MAGTFTFDEAFAPETPAPRQRQPETFSFDEASADPARQELPAGMKPSTAGAGRGSINPPMAGEQSPPTDSRKARIAEMDEATEAINPSAMPSLSGASVVRAGRREPIDERRTLSAGRVLDANIPGASPVSLARDAASGALQMPLVIVKGAGDITRLATGDRFGKDMSGVADRNIKAIKENIGSERARQQETQFQQDMADPQLDAQDVVAGNPGAMADMILPSLGSMALPIGAAGIASKLATTGNAARLAAAINPATVATRAATAGGAASTATVVAQNAASGFADSRDAGFPLDQSYLRAAITAPVTYIAGRMTGGGAEGQIARSMFGKQTAAAGGRAAVGAAIKEGAQEGTEAAGDFLGETVGEGKEFDLNKASKQIAVGTVLGGVVGVGTHVLTARIQRLKDVGETEAASHLERIVATDSAKSELASMGEAAQHPKFQGLYRTQREQGMKPAEAAARSAMATGFDELASTAGISEKAMAAARDAAAKLPIDKAPAYLDKFVAAMTARGQGQAMEPGAIADMLGQARDNAMQSVMDTVYGDTPAATMQSIEDLEAQQNTAPRQSNRAQAAPDSIAQTPITESPINAAQPITDTVAEAAALDRVPEAAAEGNASLPGSTGPLLETGATQPGQIALTRPHRGRLRMLGYSESELNKLSSMPAAQIKDTIDVIGMIQRDARHKQSQSSYDNYDWGQDQDRQDEISDYVKSGRVLLPKDGLVFATKTRSSRFTLAAVESIRESAKDTIDWAKQEINGPATQNELKEFAIRALRDEMSRGIVTDAKGGFLQDDLDYLIRGESLFEEYDPDRAAEQAIEDEKTGQTPKAGAVDSAEFSPARDAAGASQLQSDGLTTKVNQPVSQSIQAQAAIQNVAPDFTKDLTDARNGLADLQVQRKAARGTKRADLDAQIGRVESTIKELESNTERAQSAPETIAQEDAIDPQMQRAAAAKTGLQRKAKANRLRDYTYNKSPFLAFLGKNGVALAQKRDFSPDKNPMLSGYGPLFRTTGKSTDVLLQNAIEENFLPEGSDSAALDQLITQQISGMGAGPAKRIEAIYSPEVADRVMNERMQEAQDTYEQEMTSQQQAADNVGADPFGALTALDYTESDADAAGYNDADNAVQLEVNALLLTAEKLGIDTEEINYQAFDETRTGTQQDYLAAAKAALQSAIAAVEGSSGNSRQDVGQSSPAAKQEVSPSAAAFEAAPKADGTLAVKGDAAAIRETLKDIPAKSLMNAKGGVLVGRNQADKAAAILNGDSPKITAREAAEAGQAAREADKKAKASAARIKPASQGLSIGFMPGSAEAVTVKDGLVYVGKYPAQDYDTAGDVTVPNGATDEQIVQALRDAGAIAKRQRVFGLAKPDAPTSEGLTAPTQQDVLDKQDRATAGDKANTSQRKAEQEKMRLAAERKDIAKASETAADRFELGGDAMQNLTGQGGLQFSRADASLVGPMSPNPSKTPLYEAMRQLARMEDSFQTNTSKSKELPDIAKQIVKTEKGSKARTFVADIGTALHQGNRKPTLTLSITMPNSDTVKLLDIFNADTDRPFVVIGNSDAGQKVGGATAYQIAFAWAHNNGKTMRPDPAGLTVINRLRRTEAMISSAMHYGTTKHLEPHQDQYVAMLDRVKRGGKEPEDTHYSGRPDIYNELEALKKALWTSKSDDASIATNVQHLLESSTQLTYTREPATKNFEVVGGEFRVRSGRDGALSLANRDAAGQVDSKEILGVVLRPAASGVGPSTLRRAAVSGSVMRAYQQALQTNNLGRQNSGDQQPDVAAIQAIRQTLGKLDLSAPEGLSGLFYSGGTATRTPSTVAKLQAAVTELIGGKQLPNQLGRVVVTTAAEIKSHWQPQLKQNVQLDSAGEAGQAQAFYDPRTKTVFLLADNIPAGDETAVLAHELMHKHGPAVLGEAGWNRLHSTINTWANAEEGTPERDVHTYASNRVKAVGQELSSQEMFPYAVEAAIKMGIKPSMAAKRGTVASWLESVRQNMAVVWGKVTGKPGSFKAQDLTDLAFAIAQIENPESAAALKGALRGTSTGMIDENTGLPVNADGTVTVYHHTSAASAKAIRATGTLKAQAEPDVYVTTRRETDTGYGDTAVLVNVKPELLSIDDEFPDGRKDFRLNVGKPGGSIKVQVTDGNQGGRSADDAAPGVGEFQKRLLAAQDMADEVRSTGQRLTINSDGTITLHHSTSAANQQAIQREGEFRGNTWFGASKTSTMAHAKPKHGSGTETLTVKVDPRDIEFSLGTGEFYAPKGLKRNESEIWVRQNEPTAPHSGGAPIAQTDIRYSIRNALETPLPDAIIGSTLGTAAASPQYALAKSGDVNAAFSVAKLLVTPGLVAKVKAAIGKETPMVVPVVSIEAAGKNKLPLAAAELLAAKLGLDVDTAIIQSSSPKRTAMTGLDRILSSPEFEGDVVAGQSYVLVDDTLTQGATFAALASHIQAGGGKVMASVALTSKAYSAKLAPSTESITALRTLHGTVEPNFKAATGYGFDGLTQSEVRYLTNFAPTATVRDRFIAAGNAARQATAAGANQSVNSAGGNALANTGGTGGVGGPTGNLFQPNIWSLPPDSNTHTKIDRLIYEFQDNKVDLKRAQEAITKSGQIIAEKFDARLAETLYPGRVASRSDAFLNVDVKPLLAAMQRNNVAMDELADYLHARGAEERNVQIAKVNPSMPDGGAGTNTKGTLLTTQAARDYLKAVSPMRKMVLDAMAKRVDTITAGTRQLLVTEGLEKQATVDAWTATYKNYVPMFRDEAEQGGFPAHPQGAGFTVKGSATKRAMGSTKEVTNILAHVLMQREAAITRAEKNRVALALYGQALSHPNPEFWTTIKPGMDAASIGAELQAMGVDPLTAQVGMQGAPTITTISPLTGKVVNSPNPAYKTMPGAITLKVNGEDRVLMLNVKDPRGERLVASLKNLDGLTQLDLAGSIVGRSTRWLASVNTQYNPAFGLVNLTRDVLGGVINLGSTELRGDALKVLVKTPVAILGIARELATGKQAGKWGKLYQQFVADGGQTGFKENFRDPNERAKAIDKEIKALGRSKLSPGRAAHAALDLLDGFNTTLENAVRLSAYSAALDKGMSRPQAARLGRELTVDFNRKGRAGRELGPLYAFFNASVQGSARTIVALKGPTGAKIIAGGLALGLVQALMLAAAGYDDDEIPEFVKTRSLIIPLFGDKKEFVTIPYPLGLHVIPNTSRVLTELVLNGGKDIGKRSVAAIGEIAGAFNPLGGGNIFTADGALKTIAPTLLDPVVELLANKNFAGASIQKEGYGTENDGRPGVARTKEATMRDTSGQAYIGISKAFNAVTGGSDFEAGLVSPTPEMVRYLAQTVGGGVLREIEKTVNASVKASQGEEVKTSKIPVVGRFYGEVNDDDVQKTRYFNAKKDLDKLESQFNLAKKSGNAEAMERMLKEHPEIVMIAEQNRVQASIAKLNKLAVTVINDRETMKAVDDARVMNMRALNKAIEQQELLAGKVTPGQKLREAFKGKQQKPEDTSQR